MLGSRHDGEALSAARAAERMRREAQTTWPEILAPPDSDNESPLSLDDMLRLWAEHADCCLNSWERRFFASVSRRRRHPTPRQLAVIAGTAHRLLAAERRR
jgi:hypothetical protein